MQDIPIKEYLHQIWKRKRLVVIFLVSIVLLTAAITWQQPRIYRAVSVIEIGSETPDVAFFQDVVNMTPYSWWSALKYYETQYQLIQSRSHMKTVAERAVDKQLVRGWSVDSLTGHLAGNIQVKADENSRLARIYFEDTDPKRAALLANLIAKTHVEENLARKLQGVTQAVDWLNKRLVEIREEKRNQEKELQKYLEEYRLVSLGQEGDVQRLNVVKMSENLAELRTKRLEAEAKYQKLKELVGKAKTADRLLGLVTSELLNDLRQDLAKTRAERNKLSDRYMEKHPRIVKLNRDLTEIEKGIRREVQKEVDRLKTQYLLARAEEESIVKAVEEYKLEALRIDEINRRLADIRVITDTNQKIFETLQKKIKEADLSALVRSNNIRIVDKALVPGGPIRPNWATNMMLALIIGLLGGVGLALGIEYLDDTFKTHEDIERFLQLPVLGIIPRFVPTDGTNGSGQRIEFVPYEEPGATISEFYRTLRTNVLFLSATRGLKKVMMVSTGPGEGKTVTALNLAVTLAQAGEKTLIIDLDLRRPKLHYAFDVDSRLGVTNVVVGEIKLDDAITTSSVPNLDYLLAGSVPPNPAELLGSSELRNVLAELSSRYDRVIIDSSPIAPVTDAIVLAQIIDGVIFVVRAGKTHRKPVRFARDQLRVVKAEILGVLLNDVDVQKSAYSDYQYYKYGYYTYSEEADTKSEVEKSQEHELPPANA